MRTGKDRQRTISPGRQEREAIPDKDNWKWQQAELGESTGKMRTSKKAQVGGGDTGKAGQKRGLRFRDM